MGLPSESVFLDVLRALGELDVLTLGRLSRAIAEQWTDDSAGNLDVVVTGKQRRHYLARHPEMVELEPFLQETLLDPEYVYSNRSDPMMAIFYRRVNDFHFLRAAVLMQAKTGLLKHSVISYRVASSREVGKNRGRCRWTRM